MGVTDRPRRQANRYNIRYREETNQEFFDNLENNIRDGPSEYDDNYAPLTSPAGHVMENRHPHCPTLLYMYSVKNRRTGRRYLKVGITRINWELCGEHEHTPNLIIRWNRELITNEIIRNTYITRMNNELNSLQNSDNYVFIPRFRHVRLFPTYIAARRNEREILDFLRRLPGSIPNPPIRGTNGSIRTEFFNHPLNIGLDEDMLIEYKHKVLDRFIS